MNDAAGQLKAEPPKGLRSYLREFVFACVVALIASVGAIQAVAGFLGGNRQSVSLGGDTLFLSVFLVLVWGWGYWARASRRKLALEAKFQAKVDQMRAELLAEMAATTEGVNRVADLLEPQEAGHLASVHYLPAR